VFDQSCLENKMTLIAYGYCHSEIPKILEDYSGRVSKLEGDNCWEMLLGKQKAISYIKNGCWLLRNALCNTWRNETFISYGAYSPNYNIVNYCHTDKIVACRFEKDKPLDSEVASFAEEFHVPYDIVDCNLNEFKQLLLNGINTANSQSKSIISTQIDNTDKREIKSIRNTNEVEFQIDIFQNKLAFVSPSIYDFIGFHQSRFCELYHSDPDNIMYPDKDVFQKITQQRFTYISRCLTQGIQLPLTMEYKIKNKSGSYIWIKESIFPKYTKYGAVNAFFLGKLENITERKRTEDKLAIMYQKEMKYRAALERELKNRIEFTHALVHELKTPLTPIILASDALVNHRSGKEMLPLINCIHRGVDDLSGRIEELLDLARGEAGVLTLKIEPFDLNKTIGEAVKYFKSAAEKNGQIIKTNLSNNYINVVGDKQRIKQVIMNLLDNAIKYSGIDSEIAIETSLLEKKLIFSIKDNGLGIPQQKHQDIFQPYKSARNHLSSGLGIGLSLAKSIIQLHGGKIWVVSQENNGFALYFTLPIISNALIVK